MHTKNKKLEQLGITTTNNQVYGKIHRQLIRPHPSMVKIEVCVSIRECVNVRFISRTHKVVQNVTQAERNTIHALKTNRNIVIKPADKGGAINVQNRTDYCKEVHRQLNDQEHYRQLPTDPTKEHTRQLNRLLIQSFREPYALSSHVLSAIPHGNGKAAKPSVLNTTNCQIPDTILQLIHFILDHNAFIFDNQFFNKMHRTGMGTRSAPQYANIFMP
eukprot:g45842.t1